MLTITTPRKFSAPAKPKAPVQAAALPASLASSIYEFLATKEFGTAQAYTADHADYELCAPNVCCAWMGLHDDDGSGASEASPMFHFRAKFWSSAAVFVMTDDSGRFVEVPRTAELVSFNALRQHGLVPRAVADELLTRQDAAGPQYQLFAQMLKDFQAKPMLIWQWCDAAGEPLET